MTIYQSPAGLLYHLYELHAGLQGGSPVAHAEGGIVATHRDPDARMVAIAHLSLMLKDCTTDEEVALALEFGHTTLPMETTQTAVPGASGHHREARSKVSVASETLGRAITARVFMTLVASGYAKVEQRMLAAGLLEPVAWRAVEA